MSRSSNRWGGWGSLWRSSFLLAVAAPPLASQSVVGQVVEAGTGAPVGEGFAVLLDADGREVARALTSADGRFLLSAPGPGTFRLRSERIGYAAFVSAPVTLERDQRLVHQLAIEAVGVDLAPVVVTGRSGCRSRPDREQATAAVWDEVRKALAAAAWIESQRDYRYRAVRHRRDWDLGGRQPFWEASDTLQGMGQTAFRSVPAPQLAAQGYIVRDVDSIAYYGLDAAVLQDSTFLASHCFWVVRRRFEEAQQIGLSFEPEPRSLLADVRGVLWLDERSAELRTLEYRYTRVPDDVSDARIGGTVDFLRLPSGAWIVHRWQIRMPRLARQMYHPLIGRSENRTVLQGFRERGGEVLEIRTADGTVVYPPP